MAATGALGAAKRSYPTSEVRGRSWEDPTPKGDSQEELPHGRCQGWLGGATWSPRPGAVARRSHPVPEAGAPTGRSNPAPEARDGGQEEQPHIQGAVAAQVQKGLEELSNVEGQEGRQ